MEPPLKHERSLTRLILGLVVWLVACYAAAAVGGIATANAGSFYADLVRPDWAPPGWLFAPVWTSLYTMMGVAAWLVWRQGGLVRNRTALGFFLVQLAVNAVWSWIFFQWRQGALALAEIVILWALIAATIVHFRKTSSGAALLLLPYLAWVTFATFLTYATWRLNPSLLG